MPPSGTAVLLAFSAEVCPMPREIYRPLPEFNEVDNYFVPAGIRSEFEQERRYEVRMRYAGRLIGCQCGHTSWWMARDNEEFVCSCRACGETIVFALHCFHLFDIEKHVEPVAVVDAEVLDWEVVR